MKQVYRKKYLNIRKNITNKEELDKNIYQKVINNKHILAADTILIYVSTKDEVDTINIIKYLIKFKKIAIPKIENNQMNFYYIDDLSKLKKGYFNILEPISNNIVISFNNTVSITPGICFSKDKYRLGYGKGFYDKFYSRHEEIYKIGLCYQELLLDNIPYDNFDIKLDEIITSN